MAPRSTSCTYGSFTGSFSSLGLPAAVSWQSNYGSTNFSLVVGSGLPQFGIVNLLGTNLVFNGTGGTAGSNYVMLASTNLALPLTNWTALVTNIFDGSGQFHYTNHVSPGQTAPVLHLQIAVRREMQPDNHPPLLKPK
jgi:hypothetical protein